MSDGPSTQKLPNGTLIAFLAVLTPLAAVVGIAIYIGAMRTIWRRQGRWLGWRSWQQQEFGFGVSGNARGPNGKGKGGDNIMRPVIHEVWLDVNEVVRSRHFLTLKSENTQEDGRNGKSSGDEESSIDSDSKTSHTVNGEMQKVGLVWDKILPISISQAPIPGQLTPLKREVLTFIKLPSQSNRIYPHQEYQDFYSLTMHQEVSLGVTSVR